MPNERIHALKDIASEGSKMVLSIVGDQHSYHRVPILIETLGIAVRDAMASNPHEDSIIPINELIHVVSNVKNFRRRGSDRHLSDAQMTDFANQLQHISGKLADLP